MGVVVRQAYSAGRSTDARGGSEGWRKWERLAVGTRWALGGWTDMVDLAGEVAEELAIPYDVSPSEPGGSDHAPFIEAGVPAMIFNCFCDSNYHTASDRFDFLERQRLEEAGALGLGLLEALLAA